MFFTKIDTSQMNHSDTPMNCPTESTALAVAKGIAGNLVTAVGTTVFAALLTIWAECRKAIHNAPILQTDFDSILLRLLELELLCSEERGLGKVLQEVDKRELKARLNALLRRSESLHKWLSAFQEGD
jgi:hypothetical protein